MIRIFSFVLKIKLWTVQRTHLIILSKWMPWAVKQERGGVAGAVTEKNPQKSLVLILEMRFVYSQ